MYKVANKILWYNLENQVLERVDQTSKLGRLVGASNENKKCPCKYIILGIPLRGLLSVRAPGSYVHSYIVSYTVTSEAVSFLPEVGDQI